MQNGGLEPTPEDDVEGVAEQEEEHAPPEDTAEVHEGEISAEDGFAATEGGQADAEPPQDEDAEPPVRCDAGASVHLVTKSSSLAH